MAASLHRDQTWSGRVRGAADSLELVGHLAERGSRVDLLRGAGAEPWLGLLEVADDLLALVVRPAELVGLPRGDTLEDHLLRRTQQDDRAEPRVEPALVSH